MKKDNIHCCESCKRKHEVLIKEVKDNNILSNNMVYHKNNNIDILDNIFRYGSDSHIYLINEARKLWENKYIKLSDSELFENTDIGRFGLYEGKKVPLDYPMVNEAEYEGKKVELNSPKRGGSKKFYVYVKNPKTKRVMKVSFGAPGMSVGIRDPKRREAFAKRHDCKNKKDRTKASYWSCNVGRYASKLGLGKNFYGFW